MKTKDARDIILLALYAEFNREDGDYRRVTANILELEVVSALAGVISAIPFTKTK